MTPIGTPTQLTLASGDQAEVIRLGDQIGLGIATGDGAAMGTLSLAEARRLAAGLTAAADG
jgi:hypothetical protein